MVRYKTKGDTATVFLSGELDHSVAQSVRMRLEEAVADRKIRNLVLDMKELTFMDSSGLGVIIGRYKELVRRDGNVAVQNVSASVDRLFSMSGMYKIVKKI